MLRLPRFYYEGEGTGGSPPPAPANPQAVDLQHTERITRLEGSLETIPQEFTRQLDDLRTSVFNRVDEVQSEVSNSLGSVMDKLNAMAPAPANPEPDGTPATPAAPNVEVETPKPPERKVRRGHKKVTRRG